MKHFSPRAAAALIALAMATVACSGSLPDWYYGKTADTTVTIVDEPADSSTDAGGPGTVDPTTGRTILPSVGPSGTTGGPLPSVGPSGAPTPTGSPGRYVANIYSGAEDTIGITDDTIHLCGHAALLLGAAFNTSEADLNVYWQKVNAAGGIYGRRITIDWIDDRYDGTEAANAVKQCVGQDPFFVLGGIGFDQIPFARAEAERNRTLYLHHMAIADGLDTAVHSFSTQPTVEQVGTASGEFIVNKYANERVGIITRNSEYWKPGRDAGLKVLRDHNVTVTHNLEVTKNQGSYSLEIQQMQGDTDVVWIWENALVAANIIIQARHQGYNPHWVVFPFQTTLDLIKEDSRAAIDPPIDGVGTWSAYKPGGYGNAFSRYEYAEEIDRMEAAYRSYRGQNFVPNDILWQVWTGFKALHQMLLDCGKNCTRNKIAGMMLGGLRARVNPNCEANFGHPKSINNRVGLHQFIVLQSVDTGSVAHWKTVSWCRERLL